MAAAASAAAQHQRNDIIISGLRNISGGHGGIMTQRQKSW